MTLRKRPIFKACATRVNKSKRVIVRKRKGKTKKSKKLKKRRRLGVRTV